MDLEACTTKQGRGTTFCSNTERQFGSALKLACQEGHTSVASRLLELGADPAACTDTIMSQCCQRIVEAALAAGPAGQLCNLRWHSGRRQVVLWRQAAV